MTNQNYCKNDVVKKTYGFDYHSHFRNMLIPVLGLIVVERIEANIDPTIHGRLVTALATLQGQRDPEAHPHLKGMTRTINAPFVTITQFQPVYDGLLELDKAIRARRWGK